VFLVLNPLTLFNAAALPPRRFVWASLLALALRYPPLIVTSPGPKSVENSRYVTGQAF